MATATIEAPESDVKITGLKRQALDTAEGGKHLQVTNSIEYAAACQFLKGVVALRKQVADTFDPIIADAHKTHKTAIDKKKEVDGPLAEAETHLKRSIATFQLEEEKKRLAEEERLRAQLKQQAEEQSRKEADEAKLEMALDLEASGDMEGAEAVLNTPSPALPAFVPPVIVPSVVEKQQGISRKQNWKARVIDESKVPREFLMVDMQKLNQYAKAMKTAARVEGVEFYDEGSIAVKV